MIDDDRELLLTCRAGRFAWELDRLEPSSHWTRSYLVRDAESGRWMSVETRQLAEVLFHDWRRPGAA